MGDCGYCSFACSSALLYNSVCDSVCNTDLCQADNGMCYECVPGCTADLRLNGVCDEVCNNLLCGYDYPDCGICTKECPIELENNGQCHPECFSPMCRNGFKYCSLFDLPTKCNAANIADGVCSMECFHQEYYWDGGDCDCRPGCTKDRLNNLECDPQCNYYECRWDNGRCPNSDDCAEGCTRTILGNGTCDEACNNPACQFDKGDCECHPGCDPTQFESCPQSCLNYACGFANYNRPGGCTSTFALHEALSQQALDQDFYAEFDAMKCMQDDFFCSGEMLSTTLSSYHCTTQCINMDCTYPCMSRSCLFSFGICNLMPAANCKVGWGEKADECFDCDVGYVRMHSSCLKYCPRRYGLTVFVPTVCVPLKDDSSQTNPDIIYVFRSKNEGRGTLATPFGSLALALIAAWKTYTTVYLLGDMVDLKVDSLSNHPEYFVTKDRLDPLSAAPMFTRLLITSLTCEMQPTQYCSDDYATINVVQDVTLSVTSNVCFEKVRFTSKKAFDGIAVKFCPAVISANAKFVDDRGESISEESLKAAKVCAVYTDYSLFAVLPAGKLSLKEALIVDFRIQAEAFIDIRGGDVELRNVNFTSIQPAMKVNQGAFIFQSVSCGEVPCGSFTYVKGRVSFLNNGYEYVTRLSLNAFLNFKSVTSIQIDGVAFELSTVVEAYSTLSLSTAALIYLENFHTLSVSNCEFRNNFVTGGLIVVDSSLQLAASTGNTTQLSSLVHISLVNLTLSDNFGENGLITVRFKGNVLNIAIRNCTFSRNAFNQFPIISLSSTSQVTAAVSDGEVVGSGWIPPRYVNISQVVLMGEIYFSTVISVSRLANLHIAKVTCGDSGNPVGVEKLQVLGQYMGQPGIYMRIPPPFANTSSDCSHLFSLSESTNSMLTSISFSSNTCLAGGVGVFYTACSGLHSATDYLSFENVGGTSSGLVIDVSGPTVLTASWLRIQSNRNALGGIAFFGSGSVVTIRDSLFDRNEGALGACVNSDFSRSLVVDRVSFTYNTAQWNYGGVLYWRLSVSAMLVILNSEVVGNHAKKGGVVYLDAVRSTQLGLTIKNSEFRDNTADQLGAGIVVSPLIDLAGLIESCLFRNQSSPLAVLYLQFDSGNLEIVDSTFEANTGDSAAGIVIETSEKAKTYIRRVTFVNNTGGPVILKSNSRFPSMFATQNCTFSNNEDSSVVMEGGVWYDENSTFTHSRNSNIILQSGAAAVIKSSVFDSNWSPSSGGVVHLLFSSSLSCDFCTFVNNSAVFAGGVIFVEQDSSIEVSNSVFRQNTAGKKGAALFLQSSLSRVSRISFSLFEENIGGDSGVICAQDSILALSTSAIRRNAAALCPGLVLLTSVLNVSDSVFEQQNGRDAAYIQLFTSSSATISSSIFKGGRRGAISVSSVSSVLLQACSFSDMHEISGGVVSVSGSSTVTLKQVSIWNVASVNAGSLIFASDSSVFIYDSSFTDFQSGGIYGYQLSSLEIQDSEMTNSQGSLGSAVYCYQCVRVLISQSLFSSHSAVVGGVMHFSALEDKDLDWVVLRSTVFRNNTATTGGVLYAINMKLSIDSCTFEDNRAEENGGAVALACSLLEMCNYTVTSAIFLRNSARNAGGGIYWSSFKPLILDTDFMDNSALYGAGNASFPIRLQFDALFDIAELVPGQRSNLTLRALLVDHYWQVVVTDSSSLAELLSLDTSKAFVSGSTRVTAINGTFEFRDYIVYAQPGSEVELTVRTSAISSEHPGDDDVHAPSFIVKTSIRECVLGESATSQSCIVCSPGTYSLNPTHPCQSCPANAQCLGNFIVLPDLGFWRSSFLSPIIRQCPNTQACLGGTESRVNLTGQCAEGYKGNMCQSCDIGYSRSSTNACGKCLDKTVNGVRLALLGVASIVVIMTMVWTTMRSAAHARSSYSILIKIFINYLQLVTLVTEFKLSWPDKALQLFDSQDKLGGLTEQAYSVDCFLADNQISSDVYYRKMALVVLLPLPLIAGAAAFWMLVALKRRSWKALSREMPSTVVILFFLILPNLIKSLFSMFSCTEIESGKFWLTVDMDIRCWDSEHRFNIAVIGVPGIILWIFAIPLGCLAILIKQRRQVSNLQLNFKFGFLIHGYRARRFYWEFVILYRKIVLIICSVFLNGSIAVQALTVQLVLGAAFFLQYHIRPYTTDVLNLVETWAILAADITIYCGLYYLTEELSDGSSWFFFAVILSANIVFVAYWGFSLLKSVLSLLVNFIPILRDTFRPGEWTDSYMEDYINSVVVLDKETTSKMIQFTMMDIHRLFLSQNWNRWPQFKYTPKIPKRSRATGTSTVFPLDFEASDKYSY